MGWPRVHCTAHKLESIQREILAGNSGYRVGSNADLTVPVVFNLIRFAELIKFLNRDGGGSFVTQCFTSYMHSIKCTVITKNLQNLKKKTKLSKSNKQISSRPGCL